MSTSDHLHDRLINLGFMRNSRAVCGFRPHYVRGQHLIFLAGADWHIGKITRVALAYEHHPGRVYVVVTHRAPALAQGDLATNKRLTALTPQMMEIRWNAMGNLEQAFIDLRAA